VVEEGGIGGGAVEEEGGGGGGSVEEEGGGEGGVAVCDKRPPTVRHGIRPFDQSVGQVRPITPGQGLPVRIYLFMTLALAFSN
ncbi:hypothetical protein Tco_0428286, partial [Tanacetum coccineum]